MATGRKKPRKRIVLDRVDAEAIRETIQTRGWKLITLRLQKMREANQLDLEQGHTEVETAALRGYLGALRAVAAIPDILIREGMKVAAAQTGDED
jgi:hypothetical protein